MRDNFARMRAAGNTIVIGTDQFRKTARVNRRDAIKSASPNCVAWDEWTAG